MKHTNFILDLIKRSLDGPQIDADEFNTNNVAQGLARVVSKYEIYADREHLINFDEGLADRVWEAAIDFLSACGVFCTKTNG